MHKILIKIRKFLNDRNLLVQTSIQTNNNNNDNNNYKLIIINARNIL